MVLTVTVFSSSLKKLAILNTLDRTISAIMLSIIQFFPNRFTFFTSCTCRNLPIPDVHEEILKQLSAFGLIIYPSSEGGIENCFFYSLAKGLLESPSTWQPMLTNKDLSLTG